MRGEHRSEPVWRPRGCARRVPPWLMSTLEITPCHDANSWGSEEAVAHAGDGADESRFSPVVLQFHAQISHVAIDHIAPRDIVGTPERVENLFSPERLP